MPSITVASCAGESVTAPPGSYMRGQTKPPRSMRLMNRHSPFPSQNNTFKIDARLPRQGEQMAREGVSLQLLLDQRGKPVHALPHVGVTKRQVHLHARRDDHHRLFSCSATCTRTAS